MRKISTLFLVLLLGAGSAWSYDPYYAPEYDYQTGDWKYCMEDLSAYKCHFHLQELKADLLLVVESQGFNESSRTSNLVLPDTVGFTSRGVGEVAYIHRLYAVDSIAPELCKGQPWIKTVRFPSTLRATGGYVFRDCTGLTHATYPANCVCDVTDGMFWGCSSMASITLPDNLRRIGNNAFSRTAFTEFELPESLRILGGAVFSNCPGMTSLNIPAGVEYIGPRISFSSDNFTAINVDPANNYYCSVDGVLFNKNRTRLQEYPYGKKGAYVIPNSVTEITESNFANYRNLTKITIGDGVTKIGSKAFTGCNNLTTVIFGSGVDTLGQYAFMNCRALDSVVLSPVLRRIETGAFSNCEALRSIILPDSLRIIKQMAFSGCTNLSSITFGKKLEKIEIMTFLGCPNLTSITCYATTPPTLQEGQVFSNLSGYLPGVDKSTCVVYVPMSAVDAYKAATEWSEFTHIVGFREPPTEVITTEPEAIRKLVYNGAPQTLISAGVVKGSSATLKYRIGTSGDWSTALPQATDAGAYDVYYYIDYGNPGDDAEEHILGPVACVIGKIKPTLTAAPAAIPNLDYDGSAKTLIAAGSVTNGTLQYSLNNTDWSESLPTATDQGHYRVYYRVIGELPNYSDLAGYVPLVASVGITSAPVAPLHEDYDPDKIEALEAQQGEDTKGFWIFYGEGYQRLFDGEDDTKWCSWTEGVPYYCQRPKDVVVWKTEEPVKMVSYTLTTADDAQSKPGQNWKSWTLYGGTFADDDEAEVALLDEAAWTVIDNRINDNVLQAENLANYQFAVSNSDTYQYYRLVVHDIAGSGNVQQMTNLAMGLATKFLPDYITRPSARAYLQYTGAAQTLIEPGTATNGTVLYKLQGDAEWSTALPQATNVGNYYVYYKTKADEYTETEPDTLIATIYGDRTVPAHNDLEYGKIRVLTYCQGEDTNNQQGADKLFDGDYVESPVYEWRTKWCSVVNDVAYSNRQKDVVVWRTTEGVKMVSYTLRIGYDSYEYPNRNWYSWTLYGGTFASEHDAANALLNEAAWTIIDNQIKDTVLQAENLANYQFACNNPEIYQYYRLVIHDIHVTHPEGSKGVQQMNELIMGVEPSTPTDLDDLVNRQSSIRKFIRDGQLFILYNDKMYTITGARVQ